MSDFAARLTFTNGKTLEFDGPADITKETTEAIVNAANSYLLGGGGVDGAIHHAGGPSILNECKRIVAQIGTLPAGKAVITTGGRLPAKYVIHTVGPVYREGRQHEAETLVSCYRECVRIADDHAIKSLALPSISTGAFGYPVHEASEIAVRTIVEALPPLRTFRARSFRALRQCHPRSLRPGRRKNIPRTTRNFRYLRERSFMRKKLIAANWKMYKTPDQARDFFRDFLPLVEGHDRDEIVVCPTYLAIDAGVTATKGSNVAIGAQDVYWQSEGAFTGEICAAMLLAVGATHVIIGHSERRQYFGETDDTVNLKLKSAVETGLIPIVCIGEVLEEREAGLTDDVLRRQCLRAFHKVSAKKAASLVVAYEPVWAIGTGKTATPQMAADAHAIIRSQAAESFGRDFAGKLRILYGGSVKPENAHALMSEEEIDGALVGGASLDPKSFAAIVKY